MRVVYMLTRMEKRLFWQIKVQEVFIPVSSKIDSGFQSLLPLTMQEKQYSIIIFSKQKRPKQKFIYLCGDGIYMGM